MEGIPRHWSLEIFMSQVKVWIPLQISSPIMTNFRSYFWPCLYHVSVIHSMLETRTSSCINITQPSSQFPTQWGATTRNFRPFQKDYGATAGQPAWIPRAEGWENFFNKDLLMNKNCHWIHLPFFFSGEFWGNVRTFETENGVNLVKSDTYFSNGPKCQRLHFLNPIQRISSPHAIAMRWSRIVPGDLGWKELLYFSKSGMGKRDLLTAQVLSPALAVLRACAGHPRCQRTDQQLAADGENHKKSSGLGRSFVPSFGCYA